jgi:fatty acid desaturase
MQHYYPIRTNLFDIHIIRELSKRDIKKVFFDIFFDYFLIIISLIFCYQFNNIFIYLFTIFFIGTRAYSLMVIAHDGLHRRFSANKNVNDLINDFFILGAFGSACRVNRNNHIEHHLHTCLKEDPDRYKYNHHNKESIVKLFYFLSGFKTVGVAISNVFLNKKIIDKYKKYEKNIKHIDQVDLYLNLREILTILFWQVFIFFSLSYYFGIKGYFIFWLIPVYFAYRADLNRVFCEHSFIQKDEIADKHMRLVTYKSNFLEKIFFAPKNMNFHMIHHLYPQIPYYNLKKADKIAYSKRKNFPNLVWRNSYLIYIFRYIYNINLKKNYFSEIN